MIKRFFSELFAKETHVVGFMVWWRTVLISLGVMLIVMGLMWGIGAVIGSERIFDFIRISSNLIMIVVSIFILNKTGKWVARKKYQKDIAGFIGWSIFWRSFLMAFSLVLIVGLIFIGLAIIIPPIALLFFPVVIYISIITYGWAARKVFQKCAAIPMG